MPDSIQIPTPAPESPPVPNPQQQFKALTEPLWEEFQRLLAEAALNRYERGKVLNQLNELYAEHHVGTFCSHLAGLGIATTTAYQWIAAYRKAEKLPPLGARKFEADEPLSQEETQKAGGNAGNLHRSPFGDFLRATRKKVRMSAHELAGLIGAYGNINHGGAVCNWEAGRNIPSREQYRKICEAIVGTGKMKSMPPYENAVRPFFMDGSKEFTDVWNFPSVRPYKGKHPAEKPASLLEHVIEASSYPGDIVLDCFAGSGSTALAALKLGRRAVALEINPQWAAEIAARVRACGAESVTTGLKEHDARIMQPTKLNPKVPQYALFGGE